MTKKGFNIPHTRGGEPLYNGIQSSICDTALAQYCANCRYPQINFTAPVVVSRKCDMRYFFFMLLKR